ncbi:deleted in malignant brain tumors 1 protein-like isoform X1 [Acanthopagrus latus]|uniref:deleted in malignant brain tumors 1 protein-like isoform X1 n=1 Tax=Acanthopagrus latus TaxID=8177 RepID=UPI00187D084D|nr:deleted in malignant brain tumors 1 protein-like isoform X1 [Acanthopagrus latus]
MWTLVVLCSVIASYGVQGDNWWTTLAQPEETVTSDPSCGGYLHSSSGTFYSPGYPDNYPDNSECIWYLRFGSGIVQLNFPFISIEDHPSCIYDAIYVYDGFNTAYRLLGTVCGNTTATFHSTGVYMTVRFKSDSSISSSGFRADYRVVAQGSCRYNCGYQVGTCSCSSGCEYRGNCCSDYYDYCPASTMEPDATTGDNWWTVDDVVTDQPSCRYNCGSHMGSCSCSSSCQYYGNCCHDYYYECYYTTTTETPSTTADNREPTHDYFTDFYPSCRYNCGNHMGLCSCSSSCQYYATCCHDYYYECPASSMTPEVTTEQPSCRYNCGNHMGSCSCRSSCQYYGNCCPDYYDECYYTTTTETPSTTGDNWWTVDDVVTDQPSCRYNCGSHMGSCSCSSSCQYYGNCCHDYYYECPASSMTPEVTTEQPSCRYNCGNHMGSCSCRSSCQYYGNCCPDYYYECYYTTTTETPSTTDRTSCGGYLYGYSGSFTSPNYPSAYPHNTDCIWYIRPGYSVIRLQFSYVNMEVCSNCVCDSVSIYDGSSISSSLLGKVCGRNTATFYSTGPYLTVHFRTDNSVSSSGFRAFYEVVDYFSTESPVTAPPCGGDLFGSGNFTSPSHPSFYPDNAYCIWRLRASSDQRIFLAFTYMQLENCCDCDYIKVYDGSSYMGTVCNNSLATFHSSSNSMNVVFRSNRGVVARGFKAEFISSLPASSGQVSCSSDNMNIVVQRSYLNSLGYDGDNLYLNDERCRPQISSSQVVFRFPIESCGNDKKIENGRVVYTNTLRADTSSYGEITRQVHLKLNVACQMDQDSVSQIMYLVEHLGNSSIVGTGKFNTSMNFYTSSSFYYQVTQVPYKVTLNQNLYVQVDLSRQSSNLVIFLDTCVTSPSPHDFETRSYYLVRNGCPVDSTFRPYYTGLRPYARFTFRAFQFLRAAESVYIQCKVLICPASDSNSRCHNPPNCRTRVARDLGTEHDSQTLVLGPIQLRASEKKEEGAKEQDEA